MGGVGDDNSFFFAHTQNFTKSLLLMLRRIYFLDKVAFIAWDCLPRKQVKPQQIIMFLDRIAINLFVN